MQTVTIDPHDAAFEAEGGGSDQRFRPRLNGR